MRVLIALFVCVGCGVHATTPRGAAPAPAPAAGAIGAMPVPDADDVDDVDPVPAELRAAPVVAYYEDSRAITDLSTVGDIELDVPSDFESGSLKLLMWAGGMTQLVLILDEDTYSQPEVAASTTYTCRGDAPLFDVGFTDNDNTRWQMALFRLGDEIRVAVRAGTRADAWNVTRVIKIGHRAEVRVVHPDPH